MVFDFADISLGIRSASWSRRAARVRREAAVPVGVSWNLGILAAADRVIREGLADMVFLGRPALANPHWPFRAARELAQSDPVSGPEADEAILHTRAGAATSLLPHVPSPDGRADPDHGRKNPREMTLIGKSR